MKWFFDFIKKHQERIEANNKHKTTGKENKITRDEKYLGVYSFSKKRKEKLDKNQMKKQIKNKKGKQSQQNIQLLWKRKKNNQMKKQDFLSFSKAKEQMKTKRKTNNMIFFLAKTKEANKNQI